MGKGRHQSDHPCPWQPGSLGQRRILVRAGLRPDPPPSALAGHSPPVVSLSPQGTPRQLDYLTDLSREWPRARSFLNPHGLPLSWSRPKMASISSSDVAQYSLCNRLIRIFAIEPFRRAIRDLMDVCSWESPQPVSIAARSVRLGRPNGRTVDFSPPAQPHRQPAFAPAFAAVRKFPPKWPAGAVRRIPSPGQ